MRTYDHYLKSCGPCAHCKRERFFRRILYKGGWHYVLNRPPGSPLLFIGAPQHYTCRLWSLLHKKARRPRRIPGGGAPWKRKPPKWCPLRAWSTPGDLVVSPR